MGKARYICFEGVEGCGKTTQCAILAKKLTAAGYKVLLTKEPGTAHSPLTMILRGIMLDKQYDTEITANARELVSQAIRSIHLERVVFPAMDKYDFIVQDRGILSGLAYGVACGNDKGWLDLLSRSIITEPNTFPYNLYSDIVYLQGDVAKGLATALSAKQEFNSGDAMEAKGTGFIQSAANNMQNYSKNFFGVKYLNVDGKSIEDVSKEVLEALELTRIQ